MKTEPLRVSKRPARANAWASGSIFRTGNTEIHGDCTETRREKQKILSGNLFFPLCCSVSLVVTQHYNSTVRPVRAAS